MGNGLIKCDLTLETYFTYGNSASVITRPVLQRREGQPIAMRGEIGIREDGNFRPLVAHNTTHIDMPLHFLEHTPDLATVLNNPTYRINMPMLARLLDLSTWPDAQCFYEQNGVRYCERVSLEMLPAWEELQQYDALVLLTGFGAVMRQGSEPFHTDAAGFYHLPYITVEVAQRVAAAGISLLAIDCTTVPCVSEFLPRGREPSTARAAAGDGDAGVSLRLEDAPYSGVLVQGCRRCR